MPKLSVGHELAQPSLFELAPKAPSVGGLTDGRSPASHPRLLSALLLNRGAQSHLSSEAETRRNDRIIKVERRTLIGDSWRETLRDSEDSSKLNTSFVERLNLTIRQGSAYLFRRTLYHARWKKRLEDHLELLRCYYNFVRPHRALRFGAEVRTPAMQAGLITRRLTLRDVFPPTMLLWLSEKVKFAQSTILVGVDETWIALAA